MMYYNIILFFAYFITKLFIICNFLGMCYFADFIAFHIALWGINILCMRCISGKTDIAYQVFAGIDAQSTVFQYCINPLVVPCIDFVLRHFSKNTFPV